MYLYARPFIRKRLGSASRGYINWTAVYVIWLLSAVAYHTPSLETLGIDIRGDLSLTLSTFLGSLAVLASAQIIHDSLIALRCIKPRLRTSAKVSIKQLWAAVLLNSLTMAVACSTYFSFCGNAVGEHGENSVKNKVCTVWLRPISAVSHPIFQSWVVYQDSSCNENNNTCASDSNGAISPVFTMWLTLVMMLGATYFSDFAAVKTCSAAQKRSHSVQYIRQLSGNYNTTANNSSNNNLRKRRHSVDDESFMRYNPETIFNGVDRLASLAHFKQGKDRLDSMLRTMSSRFFTPDGAPKGFRSVASSLFIDDHGLINSVAREKENTPDHQPIYVKEDAPSPSFLPMFPWYSGTSADLLKTLFDLLISLKLFLGRFDMRQMLANTAAAASSASCPRCAGLVSPRDGDGVTYDYLADKDELWFDFTADTGDGGDPTYTIARCLAAQQITATVELPEGSPLAASVTQNRDGKIQLPRGELFLHGGDIAYPAPNDETYENRFFSCYEAAMPPPSHVHPGHLVATKPDLGPEHWHDDSESESYELQECCRPCQKSIAMKKYKGPCAFIIPGNHDWVDGLETYQRHILHKGWLGGWLMPQESSYFAMKLPHGWWVFGVDLGLSDDIDMTQYRYFARVAEERMAPSDQIIIMLHCPRQLHDWFWGANHAKNLRQLVRGPLQGRARVQIAGDLHFYMRHEFKRYSTGDVGGVSPAGSMTPLHGGMSSPDGGSPTWSSCQSLTPQEVGSRNTQPTPTQLHSSLVQRLQKGVPMRTGSWGAEPFGGSPPPSRLKTPFAGASPLGTSPPLHGPGCGGFLSEKSEYPHSSFRHIPSLNAEDSSNGFLSDDELQLGGSNWNLNDPEHLIICGSGGAFLHPTHVFSYARFLPRHDPAAGPMYIQKSRRSTSSLRRSYPSTSSVYSLAAQEAEAEATWACSGDGPAGASPGGAPAPGEYRCQAAFPSAETSLKLAQMNVSTFRHVNNRFDIIGGALYFLLVCSVLPRCSGVHEILEAQTFAEAAGLFLAAGWDTIIAILSESRVSLAALCATFFIVFGMAKSGGVGAVQGVPLSVIMKRPEYNWGSSVAVRARLGGLGSQLSFALIHLAAHLIAAVSLLLLLELGVETVVRYEQVGAEGYHSLFRWYQNFEQITFPDPAGVRDLLAKLTLGLYPSAIKWLMALFDVPEAIAVTRNAMCSSPAVELSRWSTIAYYAGMLGYYWLLATPAVAGLFGAYLYLSVSVLHVHYDEAFSSLQIPDYKGFLRLHISKRGDLEVFALGTDKVPRAWKEDPRFRSTDGGGNKKIPSYKMQFPSRWAPVEDVGWLSGGGNGVLKLAKPPEEELKLVDYLKITKY